MQEEFNKMNHKLDQNKTKFTSRYKYAVLAATVLFTTVVALQYTKNNPISEVPSPPISMETPMQDNTILYSTFFL